MPKCNNINLYAKNNKKLKPLLKIPLNSHINSSTNLTRYTFKRRSMQYQFIFLFMFHKTASKVVDVEKIEFCKQIRCEGEEDSACGLRAEKDGFRLKLFENECDLLKYGCKVDESNAYGIINREFCESLDDNNEKFVKEINSIDKINNLGEHNLSNCDDQSSYDTNEVCGIRADGEGYRIRLFKNKCELKKYNGENNTQFSQTDPFICNSMDIKSNVNAKDDINQAAMETKTNATNLIVVNTNMLGEYDDFNDTVDSFFAASHVFDLPVKEIQSSETRRKLLKYAGPVRVFVPVILKPKNISNDSYHTPTLSSCYHKCPTKCPDTYAPVCGVPGVVAREPSLIFQNHCFMDVAQCKMFYEKKSSTAHSSSYMETSFLFCMGDEMNAVYRFLPAIRTLQHMGRLKKKGKFRAKLRNFRYLRVFNAGRPNFMG